MTLRRTNSRQQFEGVITSLFQRDFVGHWWKILLMPRLQAPINGGQTIVFTFAECVFTHTCYCVQVKLCYVKQLFMRLDIHFGANPPHIRLNRWVHWTGTQACTVHVDSWTWIIQGENGARRGFVKKLVSVRRQPKKKEKKKKEKIYIVGKKNKELSVGLPCCRMFCVAKTFLLCTRWSFLWYVWSYCMCYYLTHFLNVWAYVEMHHLDGFVPIWKMTTQIKVIFKNDCCLRSIIMLQWPARISL